MKQITIGTDKIKSLIKTEVLKIQKKLIDEDLYLNLAEKKEFLQSLKEYKNGEKFSFSDIEEKRKLNNV